MVNFSQISYLSIFRYICDFSSTLIQSEKLQHVRVVQGEFLKFAPLCNDCQTHPTVAMRGSLCMLNTLCGSFNLPFITLDSGIDVGPMFIIFFPGPMDLLKALHFLIFGIFFWPYGYFHV